MSEVTTLNEALDDAVEAHRDAIGVLSSRAVLPSERRMIEALQTQFLAVVDIARKAVAS